MKPLRPQYGRLSQENPPSVRFPSVWLRRVLVAPLWLYFAFLYATRPGRKILYHIAPENFQGWHDWIRADFTFIPFKEFEKNATDFALEGGALFLLIALFLLNCVNLIFFML